MASNETETPYENPIGLPDAPANLQANHYLDKLPMIQQFQEIYQKSPCFSDNPRLSRLFKSYHQAALCVLGPDAIDTMKQDPDIFRAVLDSTRQLAELQDEARANREAYDLFHMRKREIVTDGTKISIHHQKLVQAQKMYDCLALSWAMRMMLFLAGGAGHPDGDYDHEPFTRNWNEVYLVEDREGMDEVILHYFWPKSTPGVTDLDC